MFWTVVVVCPAGSSVSGSTPTTILMVSVPTLAAAGAVGAGAGAAGAEPDVVGCAAGALVGLAGGAWVQAVSSTAPPVPTAAFRKNRRETFSLGLPFSSTADLLLES